MFFAHIYRMDTGRLTNRIVKLFETKKTTVHWYRELKKDLTELGIQQMEIYSKETFKSRIQNSRED